MGLCGGRMSTQREMKKRYFQTDDASAKLESETSDVHSTEKIKLQAKKKGWKSNEHQLKTKQTTDDDSVDTETHNLTEFDPTKFRPNKWRKRKSLRFMEDGPKSSAKRLSGHDPYPGDAPVPVQKIRKYERGNECDMTGVRSKYEKVLQKKQQMKYKQASIQAARSELLLTEQKGFIEPEDEECTTDLTQHDIAEAVDITSAQKFFELKLDKFGPYRMNYLRNGRCLLMGGAKGHVAAVDWQTKKLMCEINVMETCNDVKWLHIETMFAVAQRQWTYIYDNTGMELHCLKTLDHVLRMEFLPYHFLLATGSSRGHLTWLDVSLGRKVGAVRTGHGRLDVMCQNPANAILHLGHPGGTVTLWSPNVQKPLVKMLCHGGGTRSVQVANDGKYMATSGIDRTLKIWDLRMLKLLHGYKVGAGAGQMSFSQRGLLAMGMGNIVEIYKDPCLTAQTAPYLTHQLPGSIHSLQFCPYEDVLGVGHARGFSSLLVPGAGEPNFDALEANPFQTRKQRQHAEVKMLLEKVPSDMITMDTSALGKVDSKIKDDLPEEKKLLNPRLEKLDFTPRYKKKGKSKTGKLEKRKHGVQEEHKRSEIRRMVRERKRDAQQEKQETTKTKSGPYSALDRFAKKS